MYKISDTRPSTADEPFSHQWIRQKGEIFMGQEDFPYSGDIKVDMDIDGKARVFILHFIAGRLNDVDGEPAVQTNFGHHEHLVGGVLHGDGVPAVYSRYGNYYEYWEHGTLILTVEDALDGNYLKDKAEGKVR